MRAIRSMSRLFVLGVMGTLAAVTLVIAPGVPLNSATAHADVDDFSYASWTADYELDLDSNGRAIAHVTETLVAEFPIFDQNRGIVRALTTDYQGTSTHPDNFSVTNLDGDDVPFEVLTDRGYTMLLLGDDSYVHGEHTYVIKYTLRDVVLTRDDGAADEFYWDLAPFERAQPVAHFEATVTLSDSLNASLTGEARCYYGRAYSRLECPVASGGSGENTFTIGPLELTAQQGVTVALGLEPGTVTQPFARTSQPVLDFAPLAIAIIAAGLAAAGLITARRVIRSRATATGIIIPQFDVPRDLPPTLAASVAKGTSSPAAAQIIHLAVNGIIRVEEGEDPHSLRRGSAPLPRVRLLDATQVVDTLERKTVEALFSQRVAGESFVIPRNSVDFGKKMTTVVDAGTIAAEDRGYVEKQRIPLARRYGLIALIVAALALAFAMFVNSVRDSGPSEVAMVIAVVSGLLGAFAGIRWKLHTKKGAEAREYLLGVREFIRVAEADRLEILQSHRGTERISAGDIEVIHLYEKLLPYAMLFGQVRDWSQVLEARYTAAAGYSPAWYPAAAMHGLVGLSTTVTSLSSSLSSSVSYTSSSSGGSSGGGFAGGGGGGGFSGGR